MRALRGRAYSTSTTASTAVATAAHPRPSLKHLRDSALAIHSPPHGLHHSPFSYVWLRDACCGPRSVDAGTKQKLFRSSDIPVDIHPVEATFVPLNDDAAALRITWSHALEGTDQSGEADVSTFPLDYLASFATKRGWDARHRERVLAPKIWTLSDLHRVEARDKLHVDYERFKEDEKVRYEVLKQLVQYGLVFFTNVSSREKEGWNTELKQLVEYVGEARRTFYGDLWDVRSEGREAKNVAYTNLNLDLHMDLVHFQNPPRYQFLHMLRNQVVGGSSTFVDSFAVARHLFNHSRQHFSLLCQQPIAFEYINNSHHTRFEHSTIELKRGWNPAMVQSLKDLEESLFAVNYSPPFQAPFLLHTSSTWTHKQVVEALKEFAQVCSRDEMRMNIRLQEGVCAAFDNRRVLHARTSFEELEDTSLASSVSRDVVRAEIKRWLKGAYIEGDSVWDRLRVLDTKYNP